ncbi:MAG TPA: hypothetical protein PLL77_05145 [Pyrinomonadaceae bacterium]|nr:hypothetical protein [Pyrinomonadaceae bacterium]
MKNLIFLFVVSFSFAAAGSNSYAQYCGQGTNEINIYVRNGLNAVNPQYRLYPASPIRYKNENGTIRKLEFVAEYLSTTFYPFDEVYFSRWWIRPKVVRTDHAEKFIKAYDPTMFERPTVGVYREEPVALTGKIIRDSFSFRTYETDDVPYLLKVWADNYEPVYVLEAFRGGCSRKYDLLLSKYRWPPSR